MKKTAKKTKVKAETKVKSSKKPKPATAKAGKPLSKPLSKKAAPKISKADFVRSLPQATAKEVVEKGKEAGLDFHASYVHFVRYGDRKKGAKKPKVSKVSKELKTQTRAGFNDGPHSLHPPKEKRAVYRKRSSSTNSHFNFGVEHLMPGDSIQKDKEFMAAILKIGIARAKQIIGLVDHFGLS